MDGSLVDDVIVGCVMQVGAQAGNIGRNMVLASKLPETVPGTAVDRQCGSSQQAIHFAAQALMSGINDVVIAAGVEHMTSVPIGANVADGFKAGHGLPVDDAIKGKYGKRLAERGLKMFSQFEGAEILAEQYDLTRAEMEDFALKSHQRAAAATSAGHFKNEIVPLMGIDRDGKEVVHDQDEGVRGNISIEAMQKMKPLKEMQSKGKVSGGSSHSLALLTALHLSS